jgi:hypothetical protein
MLQTLMLPDRMGRLLGRLRDTARTSVEETGVNTLHAAFGFLEWYESTSSDRHLFSPLVAQFLRPGGIEFDLLVVDEASQLRPEDAIGAIV